MTVQLESLIRSVRFPPCLDRQSGQREWTQIKCLFSFFFGENKHITPGLVVFMVWTVGLAELLFALDISSCLLAEILSMPHSITFHGSLVCKCKTCTVPFCIYTEHSCLKENKRLLYLESIVLICKSKTRRHHRERLTVTFVSVQKDNSLWSQNTCLYS